MRQVESFGDRQAIEQANEDAGFIEGSGVVEEDFFIIDVVAGCAAPVRWNNHSNVGHGWLL